MVKYINIKKISKYTHLSRRLINNLKNKEQINCFKPKGFYFAKRLEWIKHELFEDIFKIDNDIISFPDNYYIYNVKIKDLNLLKINSIKKLIKFTDKYSIKLESSKYHIIDWIKISLKYDGIIISNYKKILKDFKKLKLDFNRYSWIYHIDVNGGCIWNVDKLKYKLII